MIPNDIKEKIRKKCNSFYFSCNNNDSGLIDLHHHIFNKGAEFGYQLAQEELIEKWVHQFANEEAFRRFLKQEEELTKKDERNMELEDGLRNLYNSHKSVLEDISSELGYDFIENEHPILIEIKKLINH